MFPSRKTKITSYIVFGIYVTLLIWLILFKFATNLSDLPNIRSINLIPFHYDQETNMHFLEVTYNFLVFVPLGVYVHLIFDKWKVMSKVVTFFLTSILFEIIQFVFAIGASDITDLLGNTFGGLIGMVLCMLMKKIISNKYINIINILGILIEIGVIVMLTLLLIANRM